MTDKVKITIGTPELNITQRGENGMMADMLNLSRPVRLKIELKNVQAAAVEGSHSSDGEKEELGAIKAALEQINTALKLKFKDNSLPHTSQTFTSVEGSDGLEIEEKSQITLTSKNPFTFDVAFASASDLTHFLLKLQETGLLSKSVSLNQIQRDCQTLFGGFEALEKAVSSASRTR